MAKHGQAEIFDGFECLMVSLRVSDCAILVAWKVVQTKGSIGFDVQEAVLDDARRCFYHPAGRIAFTGQAHHGSYA